MLKLTDCPGRESNPHDRKRSQDFKSCGENEKTRQNQGNPLQKVLPVENMQKIDEDLRAVVAAWPTLPEAVRGAISVLVSASLK